MVRGFVHYADLAKTIAAIPDVTEAAPVIRGQVMVTAGDMARGAQVYGMTAEDLALVPRVGGTASDHQGDLADFDAGIAIGSGIARELGLGIGDKVRLVSPQGVKTALGTSPRVKAYPITYIFTAGRYDIDGTRIYMPLAEAQSFFNRDGYVDEIDVSVKDPDRIDDFASALYQAAGETSQLWTWRQASGAFLRALTVEDNVMFVILSIIVLVATLNITSGLIMLVKNKGRDIGILRTMGLTTGSVLRVFFLCGAVTGLLGTLFGVILGCLFAVYIDPIFSLVNYVAGGGVWDPSIRGIYNLPARLQLHDVAAAVIMSLGLSFVVTIFPARRAARLNPVEALRYE
jgi:lipoprotein-releasing system permease protein